jgi:Protein of unknown function (DUF1761)
MTLSTGFMLGLIASLGFAAATLGCTFVWQNKSLKLFLIDAGYPIIAITIAGMLLSVWQ